MFRPRPSVLGMCSWSCLNLFNWCGGDGKGSGESKDPQANRPKADRFIRPFTINTIPAKVKLINDSRLYRDQARSRTVKGQGKINTDIVTIDQLQAYIDQMEPDFVQRTSTDKNNSQTTKILQNLYVTSLGGLKEKTLKSKKVNLMLNASVDLPMVEVASVETIRVPISEKEPDSFMLYMSDVADKIQDNYLKNGMTVIYCHDGNRNSMAVTAGYLLKYTDLLLSEALLHLQYTRTGFELKKGNLGAFKKPVENFAKKFKKLDLPGGEKSSSVTGAISSSGKKGGSAISSSSKPKAKSQAN